MTMATTASHLCILTWEMTRLVLSNRKRFGVWERRKKDFSEHIKLFYLGNDVAISFESMRMKLRIDNSHILYDEISETVLWLWVEWNENSVRADIYIYIFLSMGYFFSCIAINSSEKIVCHWPATIDHKYVCLAWAFMRCRQLSRKAGGWCAATTTASIHCFIKDDDDDASSNIQIIQNLYQICIHICIKSSIL